MCCHRTSLLHLGAHRQGDRSGVGGGWGWCLLECVIHVATEVQLAGQNGSLVEPTSSGRENLHSATQTSNTTTFPGRLALCVRQASQGHCGNSGHCPRRWVEKLWDMIASSLPPCCLPSAPYTCAGFIWLGTRCFHFGAGGEREKEQCHVGRRNREEKGTHPCSGDHPDRHQPSGMDGLLLAWRCSLLLRMGPRSTSQVGCRNHANGNDRACSDHDERRSRRRSIV